MVDDGGVVIENLVGVGLRAPSGRKAFYRKQVFHGVRDAMKRAAIVAALNLFFSRFCLSERDLRSQPRISIEARAKLLATVQISLRQFHWGKFLGFDASSKFADSEIEEFFSRHSFRSSGILWRSRWFTRSSHRRRFLFAFHQWPQIERRPVPVFRRVGTQAIEHRLRFLAQSAQIGFLGVGKSAAVFAEDGLDT